MRTTLDIDDDLLHASKEIARLEGKTAGEVVSRLLRHALTESPAAKGRGSRPRVPGFRPFPAKPGVVVTDEMVNRLRDEAGI